MPNDTSFKYNTDLKEFTFNDKVIQPIEVSNTRQNWDRVMINNKDDFFYFYDTTILSDSTKPENNVLNLQYFILHADRLLEIAHNRSSGNRTTRIMLLIHVDKNSYYTVRSYLFFQAIRKNAIALWLQNGDDKPVSFSPKRSHPEDILNRKFGHLPPLLTIGNSSNALTLAQLKSTSEDFSKQLYANLQEIISQIENAKNANNKNYSQMIKAKSLPQRIDMVNGVTLIQQICMDALLDASKPEGTNANSFNYKQKLALLNQMMDVLPKSISSMSLLQLYIFSYCLSPLSEQKELYEMINGTPTLCEKAIFKYAFDSNQYAEGIYQLIENSCFHSQGHNAYVSIRLYETQVLSDSSLLQLRNAINQREQLIQSLNSYVKSEASSYDNIALDNSARFYLYAQVTDDCVDISGNCTGMLDVYRASVYGDKAANSLKSIFEISPHDNDIVWHCGLRLFNNVLTMNNGTFVLASCGKTAQACFYNVQRPDESLCDSLFQTSYQIALPVTYNTNAKNAVSPDKNGSIDYNRIANYLIDSNKQAESLHVIDFALRFVNLSQAKQKTQSVGYTTADDKKSIVKQYINRINEVPGGQGTPQRLKSNEITCIYAGKQQSAVDSELIAKAVLSCVIQARETGANQDLLLLAIYSYEVREIINFLNSFLAFYGKGDRVSAMEHTQIALCLRSESKEQSTPPPLQIFFVISGSTLSAVRVAAEQYVMSNVHEFLPYAPLLRYMLSASDKHTVEKVEPLFPFDLYLIKKKECYYNDMKQPKPLRLRSQDCCFLDRIYQIIDKPLQENDYGCALKKSHFQLGSKVHAGDFYEVELLFHNTLHVYRFAYYLTRDILLNFEENACAVLPEKIMLIGYETYSGILIEQIKQFIKSAYPKLIVHSAIFTNDDMGIDRLYFTSELDAMDPVCKVDFLRNSKYIVVVPIGATLTTIYKIKNITARTVKELTQQDPDFILYYALIVVAPQFGDTLLHEYWTRDETASENVIVLQSEEKPSDEKTKLKVRYLLHIQTTWDDPIECKLCQQLGIADADNRRVLVHVDKTSTVPNLIFQKAKCHYLGTGYILSKQKNHGQNLVNENNRRLDMLKSCIVYGHTYRKTNHFMYNISSIKYYNQVCEHGLDMITSKDKPISVELWLCEQSNKGDHNGYNVIISPLDPNTSPFLKAVIDCAFAQNVRLLHLPIDTICQEEVRARYSVISSEYKELCTKQPSVRVGFYYVDDIIVTGNTLYRAANLVRTLLNESQVDFRDIRLFSGVFVLINRSSYNTLSSFVRTPEHEFHAYLHLSIPSYNTHNDCCPACDLVKRYELLIKRSTSFEITSEHYRLISKHRKRDIDDEKQWLENECKNRHGYWSWLKQWLYSNHHNPNAYTELLYEEIKRIGNDLLNDIMKKTDEKNVIEAYLHEVSKQRLIQYADDHNAEYLNLLRDNVIAGRDFYRLKSSHKAYEMLMPIACEAANEQEMIHKAGTIMLELMSNALVGVQRSEQSEWLISYIKVFSREYLAKYHHIRQAIYNILLTLLNWILGSTAAYPIEYEKIISTLEKLQPAEYFQVFMTILRRLSDLKCRYLLSKDCIQSVWSKFTKIKEKYQSFIQSDDIQAKESIFFHELPTNEKMKFMMVKYLKWLISMDEDESASQIAEKECLSVLKNAAPEDSPISVIMKKLYLENTRVIFSGIENLAIEADENQDIERLRNAKRHSAVYAYQSFILEQGNNDDGFWNRESLLIKQMIKYFKVTKELCKLTPEQLPYAYGFICTYIKEISGYEHCSLLYFHDRVAKCLSFSSGKPKNDPMSEADLNNLLNIATQDSNLSGDKAHEHNSAAAEMKETIIVYRDHAVSTDSGQKLRKDILLLRIGFPQDDTHPTPNGRVCILLEKEHASDEALINCNQPSLADLTVARNILFLRDRLTTRLASDVYTLLDMRHEYGYILPYQYAKSLEDKASIEQFKKLPERKILHISDMHVSKVDKKSMQELIDAGPLRDMFISKPPDLILITGDVAQGNTSAGNLEDNYTAAKEIIECLAYQVWGDGLLFDWRRRILIVAGNHDYASMNELEAQSSSRTTEFGKPARKDGGTMVKFAYYINFLRKLLRQNVGYLVDQDLNEVRAYDALGCSFTMLNSVAEASAIRNNKVHFSNSFINQLTEERADEQQQNNCSICLVHHTPLYTINYIYDRYYDGKIFNKKDYLVFDACERLLRFAKAYVGNKPNEISDCYNHLKKSYMELSVVKGSQNAFLNQDIAYVLEHYEDRHNERICQICTRVCNDYEMSITDANAYADAMKKMISKRRITYIFGGHYHKARTGIDIECACKIYESSKFMQTEDAEEARCENGKKPPTVRNLHFGLLELNDNETKYKYYTATKEKVIDEKNEQVISPWQKNDFAVLSKDTAPFA